MRKGADVLKGNSLDLSRQGLTSKTLPAKLDDADDIIELSLVSNDIEDASALGKLAKLKKLNLMRNPLKNIEWVAKLTELEELDISSTEVSDLSPIRTLQKLKKLGAANTKITAIWPIADCRILEVLYLSENKLPNNLLPILRLGSLKELHITNIESVNAQSFLPLVSLNNLEILDIDDEYRSIQTHILRQIHQNKMTTQKHAEFMAKIWLFKQRAAVASSPKVDKTTEQVFKNIDDIINHLKKIPDSDMRMKLAVELITRFVETLELEIKVDDVKKANTYE